MIYDDSIHVHELVFQMLPQSMVPLLERKRMSFVDFRDKKRFIQSVIDGTAGIAEVLVNDQYLRTDYHVNSYNTFHYGRVATLDGIPVAESILMHKRVNFYAAKDLDDTCYTHWSEERKAPVHGFVPYMRMQKHGCVLHYFLENKECYLLIDKEIAMDMTLVLNDIYPLVKCLED